MVQPVVVPVSVSVSVSDGNVNRMWASGETWERHRAEITRLYKQKTLKEVMEHMQLVHGFYATERMYKFRIKSWGLRKNWKEDRVKRVLESLEKVDNVNSQINAHGDTMESLKAQHLRRLEQFLRRKPTALEQLQAEHRAALEKLLRQCETGAAGNDGSAFSRPRRLRPLAPLPSMAPAPSTFTGPTTVEVPDEILRLLGTYLDLMKADSGMKKLPKQDERMLEFVLKFRLAHNLILTNHHKPAFLCLSVCFEFLSEMLVPQGHPMTFLFVLNAALEVSADYGVLPDILTQLFRYLAQLAEIRLGSRHPATEISKRFLGLAKRGEECRALLGVMRRLRADSYSTGIIRGAIEEGGKDKEVAFSVYDKTVEVWSASHEHPHQQEGVSLVGGLQRLLTEWELVQQSFIMTLWLRMRTSIAILDEQGEAGAAWIGDMLEKNYPNELLIGLREPVRLSLVLQCYRIRGYMWLKDGMVKNAEYMFWMGKVLAEATWGKGCEVALGFAEDERKLAESLGGGMLYN